MSSHLANGSVLAFLVGVSWILALWIYDRRWNVGTPALETDSWLRIAADIGFVGGGSGVALHLTANVLSAFSYGLAGTVVTAVVLLAGDRYHGRTPAR